MTDQRQPENDANSAVMVPGALRKRLLKAARTVTYHKGQVVIETGSSGEHAYLVLEGSLDAGMMSPRGREMTFRTIAPGMMFGEIAAIDQGPRSITVTAATDCKLAEIRAVDFIDALENEPGAGLWIARQMAAQWRETTTDLYNLGTMPVASRIQNELLRMAEGAGVNGDEAIISGAPTHSAIAARIGSHREAVTRELRALAAAQIIEQKGRTLRILSVSRLKEEIRRSTGETRD